MRPRGTGRGLEHEAAKFGVEFGQRLQPERSDQVVRGVSQDLPAIRTLHQLPLSHFFLLCQRLENVRLAQREPDLFLFVAHGDDKILDLESQHHTLVQTRRGVYLVTPHQGFALLHLCLAPDIQQLLYMESR